MSPESPLDEITEAVVDGYQQLKMEAASKRDYRTALEMQDAQVAAIRDAQKGETNPEQRDED